MGKPEKSGVEGVWQVKLKNRYIYLIKDGQYALTGDLINLQDGQNLTENYRRANVIDALSRYTEKDMIIYEPNGTKKATLTVFTDTSCPYCKKLHEEVPELLKAGIRVRYLPYARGGKNGPGYQTLRSVWCSKDRKMALTNAKLGKLDGLSPGDCAQAKVVDRAFRTGAEVGVTGT
ncbi:MAG: DsbC family protein, partial [bacterium]|nr:DsbC family protein [bacterium]